MSNVKSIRILQVFFYKNRRKNSQWFWFLSMQSLVLLLKMRPNAEQPRDHRRGPEGYFLLLPSESGSMLLKSIAVNELLLPTDGLQPRLDDASEETRQVMASCLDQVGTVVGK